VARIHSGISGPPLGVLGDRLFRRSRSGKIIDVPRHRNDRASPAQLACRARFTQLVKLGSKVYLSTLKPNYAPEKKWCHALGAFLQLSMPRFEFEWVIPHLFLLHGLLPKFDFWTLRRDSGSLTWRLDWRGNNWRGYLGSDVPLFVVWQPEPYFLRYSPPTLRLSDGYWDMWTGAYTYSVPTMIGCSIHVPLGLGRGFLSRPWSIPFTFWHMS
jgi:hypothetical protein